MAKDKARQVGALPYRTGPDGQVEIMKEVLNAEIVWRFDELEPRQLQSDAGPASFPARTSSPVESPQRPELSDNASEALRASATALLTLVRELEEHGNADVD